MKYVAIFITAFLALGGCASSSSSGSAKNNKAAASAAQTDGIVDEEFDLLIAPQYDYGTDIPYEIQIKNAPQTKPSEKKPSAKPKAQKQ